MIVRHLTSLGRWDLRPTDSKSVVAIRVDEVCALDDHRLWSQYEHFRVFHLTQRHNDTRTVYVGLKTILQVSDELQEMVQHTLAHTSRVIIDNDVMRPGPSQEGRARKGAASSSQEEGPPAKAFASSAHLTKAPWDRAAVAAAAVSERGGAGNWWKPQPALQPASKGAPWNKVGYFPASRMVECDRPLPGQALSANMPAQCP